MQTCFADTIVFSLTHIRFKGVRSLHIEGFNAVVYQYFNYIIDTLKLIHMIIFEIPPVGGRVINRPLAESRYYVIKND
jgi:hypothetical protein